MQRKMKKKWDELVRRFETRHREKIKDWLPYKRGDTLFWVTHSEKGHVLYVFRDEKRDRWSLYCRCPKCNGEIARLARTTRIFYKLKKLFK